MYCKRNFSRKLRSCVKWVLGMACLDVRELKIMSMDYFERKFIATSLVHFEWENYKGHSVNSFIHFFSLRNWICGGRAKRPSTKLAQKHSIHHPSKLICTVLFWMKYPKQFTKSFASMTIFVSKWKIRQNLRIFTVFWY